jgi:hypothetical protein
MQSKRKLLQRDVTGLSDRHIEALEFFIDKFVKGAREHGDLVAGKDWTLDRLEENVDDAFYTIFMLLDMLGGVRRGKSGALVAEAEPTDLPRLRRQGRTNSASGRRKR